MKKTPARIGLILATPLVLVVILLMVVHRQSYRVVAHWPQPSTVHYDTADPHHFLVVESDRDWRGFPLSMGRRYFLLVGGEISGDQDGHRVDFSFHPGSTDLGTHIRNCSVEWTPAGVSFQEPTGDRVFIPKEQFTGTH